MISWHTKTCEWMLRLLGAVASLAPAMLGAQVATRPAPPMPATALLEAEASTGRLWSVMSSISSVFESNIEHDEIPVPDYGAVTGLGARIQSSATRPAFVAEYEVALHRYARSDSWDRVSQRLRGAHEYRFARWLRLETAMEITLRGSSEDRDISDQFALRPRVELRSGDGAWRLRAIGMYRLKRYGDASGRDAVNRHVEIETERRFGDTAFKLESRFETNASEAPRYRYARWVHGAELTIPVDRHELELELKYRQRRYANRFVDLDDEDVEVLRRDRRWTPSVVWTHSFSDGLSARVGYEMEFRRSNDPEKQYNAHQLLVGVSRRW